MRTKKKRTLIVTYKKINQTSMTPQESINYLINAVHAGQQRGAWHLSEATILAEAVEVAKKITFAESQNELKHKNHESKHKNPNKNLPVLHPIPKELQDPIPEELQDINEKQKKTKNKIPKLTPTILGLSGPVGPEVNISFS